ncbi:MAG: hypothetical protein KAW67_00240 [Candidatus Eisenbacteria sp.]|nr:hypothetical protein [Candidatus Eisenbacteria bacterium]
MTKRQERLTWMSLSPKRALAVAVTVLVFVAATLAAAVALPGCAPESNGGLSQGGRGGAMRPPPGPSVYEIITRLELEPEQLPAVRAVLERAEDELEGIQEEMLSQMSGRPDPSMMASVREKMEEARTRTEDGLSELLTYEQMAEYRKMMDEADRQRDSMRPRLGGRPGGGRGGKGGGRGF